MFTDEQIISKKFDQISSYLNEKTLRIWAAVEAQSFSRGGITKVSKATGIARSTIHIGISELNDANENSSISSGRIRRKGGGRKKISEINSDIKKALENLVDASTRGDPESALKWTSKSTYNLADELNAMGHKVSQRTVYSLLDQMEYSMQSNRKTREGADHPDRDAQFHYISDKVKGFQLRNQPVISVDTKKKN